MNHTKLNPTANRRISIFEPVKALGWAVTIAFSAPIVPLLYLRENRGLVFGFLLIAIAIVFVRYGRSFIASFKTVNPWIWALLLYTILSILWAGQSSIAIERIIQEVIIPIIFLAMLTTGYSSSWLNTKLRFLVTLLLVISIFVCLIWPDLGVIEYPGEGKSWLGIMSHKNELGRVCLFCVICWIFTTTKSSKSLILWGIVVTSLAFVTLYFTNNAVSMLVLVFILVFFVITRSSKLIWTPLWYFLLCTSFVAVGYYVSIKFGYLTFEEVLGLLTQSAGKDITLTGRSGLWGHIWNEISNRPLLGTGYGVAWNDDTNHSGITYVGETGWVAGQAHNSYLGILLKTGFIGLALWLMIIFTHIRNLLIIRKVDSKLADFHFAVLLMILACGFFSTLIYRGLAGAWNIVIWASIIEACYLSKIYRAELNRIAPVQSDSS